MNSSNYGSYHGWKIYSRNNPSRDALYTEKLITNKVIFDTSIVFQVSARAEFADEVDTNNAGDVVKWGQLFDSVY